MHVSPDDKCALVGGDDFPHPQSETQQEDLGKQFGDDVDQDDWPVVGERGSIRLLR